MTASLALGAIGNCAVSALVDTRANIVWSCMPRPDGDPVFHALLGGDTATGGFFAIELEAYARSEQVYEPNTAVLRTRLYDAQGQAIEVTDFAPRFVSRGRMYRPVMLVRRLRVLSGTPRVRPGFDWGRETPRLTQGSHHVRYVGAEQSLRLTSSAPLTYVLQEQPFVPTGTTSLLFGPDEPLSEGIEELGDTYERETLSYWREWTRRLALPLEWQDAVIRAAITLKLCVFEDTRAILAALTTSIPEADGSQRNWDYRYCWLRDYWQAHADAMRERLLAQAWNPKRKAFTESLGGEHLDASVLLMAEVGFIDPRDPRFVATVDALEATLCDGPYMRRYEAPDDFGSPETAFSICSFWRIDALARIGRKEQSREVFGAMLAARNHVGLMSEDTHPVTGEMWGNFPQTYSMVGI